MNDFDFLLKDKELVYSQLILEIRRFNILLSIAKDEKINIPKDSFLQIKEKIENFISERYLCCLSNLS